MGFNKENLMAKSSNGKDLYLVNEKALFDEEMYKKCQKYLYSDKIIEPHRMVLKRYYNYLMANGKIKSSNSVYNSLHHIYRFCLDVRKPFEDIIKEDIVDYISNLKTTGNLVPNTIIAKQMYIKAFYKWFYDTDDYPKIVKWLSTINDKKSSVNENEILSYDEVKKLIECCDTIRDKCIIMVFFESGCRIGELISLKFKNVLIKDNYVEIRVKGKTGKRNIVLVDSEPYIREWINNHIYGKKDENAPFFYNQSWGFHGAPLLYQGIRSMLITSAKRAGIKKRVNPHIFRHSAATHFAKKGWQEKELRLRFGWSASSNIADIYTNFGQKHIKNKYLIEKGLLKDESDKEKEEIQKLKPKICPRCNKSNPFDAKYCNCGMALDIKTLMEDTKKRENADNLMNELFDDKGFQVILKNFLKEKMDK